MSPERKAAIAQIIARNHRVVSRALERIELTERLIEASQARKLMRLLVRPAMQRARRALA